MLHIDRLIGRNLYLLPIPRRYGQVSAAQLHVEDRRRANVELLVGAGRRRESQRTQEGVEHRDCSPAQPYAHESIVSAAPRAHHEISMNGSLTRGKTTRKRAPPPGALPAVASPPWTWAIDRTIARPSPVPGTARE